MRRRTGQFTARAEDGSEEIVHVYTGYIVVRSVVGPPELLAEDPELRTADGVEVEKVGPGTYRVATTGRLLRSAESTDV